MKRIHSSTHISPRPFAVFSAAFFASVVLLAFCILFLSCSFFAYKRPFADAYYEDNFIADVGFDKFVGASTTVPAEEVTGSWDFAYRYIDGWSANPVQYMSLTDTGSTASAYGTGDGLSSSSKVFRLEMKNLITNGDFEAGAGTWATVPSTGSSASATWTTSSALNHSSMLLTLDNDSNYLTYTPVINAAEVIAGKKYQMDFRWVSNNTNTPNSIMVNSPMTLLSFDPDTGHALGDFTAAATNVVTLKSSVSWDGTIDDVTVRKVNEQRLRLLLKKTETTPNLEEFLYRFTFWVHPDTSVVAYTSPYHLDKFNAQMLQIDGGSAFSTNSDEGKYQYSASSGWQKMTVYIDNGNLQIVPGTEGAVMELSIDLVNALPGCILIAQPELRAYPDGY